MNFSLDQIIALVDQYKYVILVPFVIFEGPIATVIGGFLVSQGVLNFFVVYFISLFGDLAGDSLYWLIGRSSRGRLLTRMLHHLGMRRERFLRLEAHFSRRAARTLFLGKFVYGFETVSLIAAGAAKVPFLKFTIYTMLPSAPKSLVFLLIGYYFGHAYNKINKYLDNVALAVAIAVSSAVVIYLVYRFALKRASKIASKKL